MIWYILIFLFLDSRYKVKCSNCIVVSSSQIRTLNFFENVILNCYHHSLKHVFYMYLQGSVCQSTVLFLYVFMFLVWA